MCRGGTQRGADGAFTGLDGSYRQLPRRPARRALWRRDWMADDGAEWPAPATGPGRPDAAAAWVPAEWCGRLAPPHTKHLLTFHVPVECAVDVEDGVMPPLTRRALLNRANATAATVLAAGNWYPPASLRANGRRAQPPVPALPASLYGGPIHTNGDLPHHARYTPSYPINTSP